MDYSNTDQLTSTHLMLTKVRFDHGIDESKFQSFQVSVFSAVAPHWHREHSESLYSLLVPLKSVCGLELPSMQADFLFSCHAGDRLSRTYSR